MKRRVALIGAEHVPQGWARRMVDTLGRFQVITADANVVTALRACEDPLVHLAVVVLAGPDPSCGASIARLIADRYPQIAVVTLWAPPQCAAAPWRARLRAERRAYVREPEVE